LAEPLPLEPSPRLDDDTLREFIATDARNLTEDLEELDKFRSYYEGDQELNFASQNFIDAFGSDFVDFRSNWMEVVISAMEERLDLQRINIRSEEGSVEEDVSDSVDDALFLNEFEELQLDLYNGALVEGMSYVIVWPDELLGARIDANYAQNVLITYSSIDSRVIERAIKRWVTDDGGQRLTLYTRDFIYKYKVDPFGNQDPEDVQPRDTGWEELPIELSGDPSWPLPNPFGEVPIVEFHNKGWKSELRDLVPLQDALNMDMRKIMVAGEYYATPIDYMVTSNEEPDGGWRNEPGYIRTIQPEVDFEGNVLPVQVGRLMPSDPTKPLAIVETYLQHIAAISKTPSYYFYLSSKQGGRGDAPSGEALRVAETGLLKKVQMLQRLWGVRWLRVARLVEMALSGGSGSEEDVPIRGEAVWTHPMAHFLSILLEEARQMIHDLGLPAKMAWEHIGLTEDQIADAETAGFDPENVISENEISIPSN
jgi:hypothetical protein